MKIQDSYSVSFRTQIVNWRRGWSIWKINLL